jgi:hypothetical protein
VEDYELGRLWYEAVIANVKKKCKHSTAAVQDNQKN